MRVCRRSSSRYNSPAVEFPSVTQAFVSGRLVIDCALAGVENIANASGAKMQSVSRFLFISLSPVADRMTKKMNHSEPLRILRQKRKFMKLQLRELILRSHPNGNELKSNRNELRNKVRLKMPARQGAEAVVQEPNKIGSVALTDTDAAYSYRSFISSNSSLMNWISPETFGCAVA
jgi:hypothetical protein